MNPLETPYDAGVPGYGAAPGDGRAAPGDGLGENVSTNGIMEGVDIPSGENHALRRSRSVAHLCVLVRRCGGAAVLFCCVHPGCPMPDMTYVLCAVYVSANRAKSYQIVEGVQYYTVSKRKKGAGMNKQIQISEPQLQQHRHNYQRSLADTANLLGICTSTLKKIKNRFNMGHWRL